ncbi:MAG: hypothetical protein QF479_07230 [Candidatus Poseidoniaceae archaeon]|jgi:hypothetical protein|nr:hypothetical protein [Candidatus Poseidoniaceae archaeon]HJM86871.1 hypothetical protein [Candidatus Thalassarchaeaceae archaeon]
MEIDKKAMMAELGGAFTVSLAVGFGAGNLEWAIALAVVWMAFGGAHVLPVVTWCHMLTSDLSDGEGNWAANGMRLGAQIVGAILAILLGTHFGDIETGWAATDMWITDIADGYWAVISTIAVGAVWWQIHTRCDTPWVSAVGLMVLGGMMTLSGANEMAASITSMGDGIVDTLVNWILDGAMVGLGALIGVKIDEAI